MPKKVFQFLLVIVLTALPALVKADANSQAVERVEKIVAEVVQKTYPELKDSKIEVKTFSSESDYFQSRFSASSFILPQKLHYIVFVNPQVFAKNAPEEGIRSIIAHELAHVLYYKRHNRLQLLGLVNLSSKSFTVKFERRADLEAISRGYGEGLKEYRAWLYQNIPEKSVAQKKRNYFSPEEIDAILLKLKEKPEIINTWRKKVPRNLTEIQTSK